MYEVGSEAQEAITAIQAKQTPEGLFISSTRSDICLGLKLGDITRLHC